MAHNKKTCKMEKELRIEASKRAKKANRDFQKTLTEEEIKAPSYLDWSNERLGEFTRLTAKYLETKTLKGYENVTVMAALFLLVSQVDSCNAGEFNCVLSDVTSERHPESSNWEITIKKIEKAA